MTNGRVRSLDAATGTESKPGTDREQSEVVNQLRVTVNSPFWPPWVHVPCRSRM